MSATQKRFEIIPAGGSGSRMQANLPKQFLLLNEIPVIVHTLQLFLAVDGIEKIIVPVAAEWKLYFNELKMKYALPDSIETVEGGATRFQSVKNALSVLPEDGIVSIHDAARPLATSALIEKCFIETTLKGSAVAAVALKDSVYELSPQIESMPNEVAGQATNNGSEYKSVNRNNYRLAQTPQCFQLSAIKKAYQKNYQESFTDDASVYEAAGFKLNLIEGESTNIKITTPEDLLFAEIVMKNRK